MAKTPFDYWKDLTQLKAPLEEESGYSPYLITRFISMMNISLQYAEEISHYDLPKEVHYDLVSSFLPKRYLKFDYLKKKKEEKDCKFVAKYFEFGSRDLKLAMAIMSDKEIDTIKKKYGGLER